jgi:hypothetical protein
MDATIVSAMAAVLGSLVGGSAMEIRARETLYGEFIRECSKLVIDSFTRTLDKPDPLLPAYELLNRIRLSLVVRISS